MRDGVVKATLGRRGRARMTCLAPLADADGRNGTNVLGRVHVSVDNKVSMPSVCLDGRWQLPVWLRVFALRQ